MPLALCSSAFHSQKGALRCRVLLILIAVLLLANIVFFALRATLGPVSSWLHDQPAELSLGSEDAVSLELLAASTTSRQRQDHEHFTFDEGELCTYLDIDIAEGPAFGGAAEAQQNRLLQLEQLQQRLAGLGIDTQAVHVAIEPLRRIVLYVSGVDEADAKRTLRELHAKHLDAFLLTLGSGEKVVSLGLYRNAGEADAAQREFSGQGIDVAVGEYSESESREMLVLAKGASENLSGRLLAGLGADFTALNRLQKYCASIASPAQLD